MKMYESLRKITYGKIYALNNFKYVNDITIIILIYIFNS